MRKRGLLFLIFLILLAVPAYSFCLGDFNNDGGVDNDDFGLFQSEYGKEVSEETKLYDLDNDDDIDFADFTLFSKEVGKSCGLAKPITQAPLLYVRGVVFDSATNKPLRAEITYTSEEGLSPQLPYSTNTNGEFEFLAPQKVFNVKITSSSYEDSNYYNLIAFEDIELKIGMLKTQVQEPGETKTTISVAYQAYELREDFDFIQIKASDIFEGSEQEVIDNSRRSFTDASGILYYGIYSRDLWIEPRIRLKSGTKVYASYKGKLKQLNDLVFDAGRNTGNGCSFYLLKNEQGIIPLELCPGVKTISQPELAQSADVNVKGKNVPVNTEKWECRDSFSAFTGVESSLPEETRLAILNEGGGWCSASPVKKDFCDEDEDKLMGYDCKDNCNKEALKRDCRAERMFCREDKGGAECVRKSTRCSDFNDGDGEILISNNGDRKDCRKENAHCFETHIFAYCEAKELSVKESIGILTTEFYNKINPNENALTLSEESKKMIDENNEITKKRSNAKTLFYSSEDIRAVEPLKSFWKGFGTTSVGVKDPYGLQYEYIDALMLIGMLESEKWLITELKFYNSFEKPWFDIPEAAQLVLALGWLNEPSVIDKLVSLLSLRESSLVELQRGAIFAITSSYGNNPEITKRIDAILDYPRLKPEQTIRLMISHNPFFMKIYSHPYIGKISSKAKKGSFSLAVYRYMDENPDSTIDKAINEISSRRDRFGERVILGNKTYLIYFTHEAEPEVGMLFSNERIEKFSIARGVTRIADRNLKGAGAKQEVLSLIENSKDKGETTVWFSGHGLKPSIWLDSPDSGGSQYEKVYISFKEFGDSLALRGKLNEVVVILDACFSYNFAYNVKDYLVEEKGIIELPIFITETNKGRYGYGEVFISSLEKLNLPNGQALLGNNIFDAEESSYEFQDSAVIYPETGGKSFDISLNSLGHGCDGLECNGGRCSLEGSASLDSESYFSFIDTLKKDESLAA